VDCQGAGAQRDPRKGDVMSAHVVSVLRLLRPYWHLLAIAFVAMLVTGAADLLEPWPLKMVFDYVLGTKQPPAWLPNWFRDGGSRTAMLTTASIMLVVVAVVGAVSSYTQKYLSTTVGKRVGYDLRHMLYHHIQRLSLAFYESRRTGDMVVRLTSDIDAAEDFITNAVLGILLDLLTLAGMIVVMLMMDWRFSLIALSIAPLLFVLVHHYTRRIKVATRAVKRKESELASVVQESIASARIVKTFAREAFEEQRLDRESQESVDVTLQARSIKAILPPLVDVIVAVGTCLVLWFGAHLVMQGRLTAGALLVFLLYLAKMYKPMKDLSKMTDTLSKAAVAFERVGEIMAVEGVVHDLPGARQATRFSGRITFAHVRFGYAAELPVLKDVDLTIEPGQRAALVGLTGSGKSTLLGLIPRLYDTVEGEVLIDGRDVRSYTLQSLRELISVVLQEPVLFRATIAENIAYGRQGATPSEVFRREAGARRRVRRAVAAGLRHSCRRAWRNAVGWTAAAHHHCPRHRPKRADSAARRTVGGARSGIRGTDLRRPFALDAQSHVDHHRAPARDRAPRRCDFRFASWRHCGTRHPSSAAGGQSPLRPALPHAVPD
jgi:ATP-binding cassette, subfamily B, bacterial